MIQYIIIYLYRKWTDIFLTLTKYVHTQNDIGVTKCIAKTIQTRILDSNNIYITNEYHKYRII